MSPVSSPIVFHLIYPFMKSGLCIFGSLKKRPRSLISMHVDEVVRMPEVLKFKGRKICKIIKTEWFLWNGRCLCFLPPRLQGDQKYTNKYYRQLKSVLHHCISNNFCFLIFSFLQPSWCVNKIEKLILSLIVHTVDLLCKGCITVTITGNTKTKVCIQLTKLHNKL